jgi:hypothetical protein
MFREPTWIEKAIIGYAYTRSRYLLYKGGKAGQWQDEQDRLEWSKLRNFIHSVDPRYASSKWWEV